MWILLFVLILVIITIPPLTYSPPQLVNWKAFVACMFTSKKAPGYDSIPMHVIKFSFHLNSAPLADIINLSLLKGIFPDKLKIAKIIPIFKAEDPNFFVNYRPITLLSNFSKFFENVIYNRLVEFAEKHDILYRCQFGFRKNPSTSHALIHIGNHMISSAIWNK